MILLVIMSMLALFTMVLLAFVIVARQHRQAATAALAGTHYDDAHEEHLNQAALQVIRGTNNPLSVIGPSGLLEDIYGPGFEAQIETGGFAALDPNYVVGQAGTGGMMYIQLANTQMGVPLNTGPFKPVSGYYVGRVITMLDGPAKGQSSRITGYGPIGGVWTLRLLPFPGMEIDTASGGWKAEGAPQAGDRFLINGRPFSGPGIGYDPANYTRGPGQSTALLDWSANAGGPEVALLPNPRSSDFKFYMSYMTGLGADIFANEDYDAADYQNLFLALKVSRPAGSGGNYVPIPSYHRPALIRYWASRLNTNLQFSASTAEQELKRKIFLRPLPEDHHADFAAVNPAFDPTSSAYAPLGRDTDGDGVFDLFPWDVDNDGDGVADSIWIDLGMPVETAPDGRQYKPLFAILCLDQDGKLNLNAHGQLNDWNNELRGGVARFANPRGQTTAITIPPNPNAPTARPFLAGQGETNPPNYPANLPTGLGRGPQEISLSSVTGGAYVLVDNAEFRKLLRGARPSAANIIEGRYGEGHLLPVLTNDTTASAPVLAGMTGSDDNLPADVFHSGTASLLGNRPALAAYGSPPDLDGNAVVALDPRGQPRYFWAGAPNGSNSLAEANDEAEELDPSQRRSYNAGGSVSSVDRPFGIDDLEWLLRANDVDAASLGSRIAQLAPNFAGDPYRRSLATTENWDIPAPSYVPTPEIARGLDDLRQLDPTVMHANLGILDLVRGKILATQNIPGGAMVRLAEVNQRVDALSSLGQQAIAPELIAGLRFNVNRPFGNNVDDDGDAIVDEPDEAFRPGLLTNGVDDDGDGQTDEPDEAFEKLWGTSYPVDRNGDGQINALDANPWVNVARYNYAKQLYVLMSLLTDSNYALANAPNASENLGQPRRRELTAYRLAQWTINVVDFRDQDAIMTPFEYVIDPFDDKGWNLDGDVTTDESDASQWPQRTRDPRYNPNRRVVWGREDSGLLITETKAFHDVRLRDTDQDPTGRFTDGDNDNQLDMGGDPTYDSVRIPEGSLFVELFSTRNPIAGDATTGTPDMRQFPFVSGDLFDAAGNLDLGRMAGNFPVWRLAITEPHPQGSDTANVRERVWPGGADADRDQTGSFEPEPYPGAAQANNRDNIQPFGWQRFSVLPGQGNQLRPVEIERVVWFTNTPPPAGLPQSERNRIYYNQTGGNLRLAPGRYAVVGPHRDPQGAWWARTGQGATNKTKLGWTNPPNAPPEISLNTPVTARESTVGAPAAAGSSPWDAINTEIAGAVGIPCAGDRRGREDVDRNGMVDNNDVWKVGLSISEPLFSAANYYSLPDDNTNFTNYADLGQNTQLYDRYAQPKDQPEDQRVGSPAFQAGLATNTHTNHRTVFLQRLADPTRDWHPVSNPYITVDWMPIDLTIFNGEAAEISLSEKGQPLRNTFRFSSRERGQAFPNEPGYDLWSQRLNDASGFRPTMGAAGQGSFFYNLDHTFGYLNEPFHDPNAATPWLYATNPYGDPNLIGGPRHPFPWLTWNNRPFTSASELMLVPAASSGRLLWEFDVAATPYDERTATRPSAPYGHLLNFFFSSRVDSNERAPNGAANDKDNAGSNYFRLFDFVSVPSRYSGTETLLNPAVFNAVSGRENFAGEFYPFYAPYNRLSAYREPGRVNINTMADSLGLTWLGLTNRLEDYGGLANWGRVVQARQGYAAPPLTLNPGLPTYFGNPFRPAGSLKHVPVAALQTDGTNFRELIEGTTHRSFSAGGAREPLFSVNSADPHNNTDRNAYFRYHGLQKMDNLLTTRSNVYAIWITVGFFEVERVPQSRITALTNAGVNPQEVYPDGYWLKGELGMDTGEIRRHRGFYIFDRSIPVAFQRGENHNVHHGLLLQRIIE